MGFLAKLSPIALLESLLSGKQKGVSAPVVPKAPKAPTKDSSEVSAARENERKRRIAAAGRGSTILTSGAGVLGEAPVTRKKLLGG